MAVPPTNAEADAAVPAAGTPSRTLTNAFLKDLISTDVLKAPLASPTFTGTPAAPTASQGTNTTQLATTAFVVAATAALQANLGRRGTVRAATTANITIATALNNADTLDGVTLATGDLVLVKNQSAPAENGVYEVGVSPARATEFDTWNDHPGALLAVQEGTTQADTLWLCTTNVGGTLNTTAINFSQFSAAGALLASNNLSDLASAATARTNLGLSALATTVPGTNVATFLATPTSANLRAAVTDEAGTGALLFANDPATLSTGTTLNLGTHGNRLLICDTAATHSVDDDTGGAWVAGSVLYGINTSSGNVVLQGDGTSTVTAGAGQSLTVYPGQEWALQRTGTNAWRGGATAPEVLIIPIGDETTAITTGTAKVTFRFPYAGRLVAVRASLTTASSSGTPTFDLNEGGTTMLSTKLTVDASELTSTTAAAAVISDATFADDAVGTIDIDTAGTGAAGAKIALYMVRGS